MSVTGIAERLDAARERLKVAAEERRPFFTPKTLAQYLAISERTVRQMAADGRIPSYRVEGERWIYADDVDAYLAARRDEARTRTLPNPGNYERWPEDERGYASVLCGDPCCYCGGPTEVVDHIVARSRGGLHEWSNFTAACVACNSAKNARPLLAFLLRSVAA